MRVSALRDYRHKGAQKTQIIYCAFALLCGNLFDSMKGSKTRLTVFVALLRGVNVGGNNMISMRSLKESFETMGFTNVSTYINSGNIIFQSKEDDPRKLERKIEQMLSSDYQLDSKVVLRSLSEMEKLVQALPRSWNDDSGWRYNVIFLRHSIDSEKILDELPANSDIEELLG